MSNEGMLLVPQLPQFRTIMTQPILRNSSEDDFDFDGFSDHDAPPNLVPLCFPHSLFFIHYEKISGNFCYTGMQAAFSKTQLSGDPQEVLYGLPLGNIDEGYEVCMGDLYLEAKSLEVLAKKTITLFWSSPFSKPGGEFSFWETEYKENKPTFWSRWRKSGKNSKFIEKTRSLISSRHVYNVGQLLKSYNYENVTVLNLKK